MASQALVDQRPFSREPIAAGEIEVQIELPDGRLASGSVANIGAVAVGIVSNVEGLAVGMEVTITFRRTVQGSSRPCRCRVMHVQPGKGFGVELLD